MKRLLCAALSVGLAAVLGLWWFSPREVVKRKTGKLLELLTFGGEDGKGGRQMGVYALNALLANEVTLAAGSIAEANGTFERIEMESAYSWLAGEARESRFELEEIEEMVVEDEWVSMRVTLDSLVELPNYRPVDGRFRVFFKWQREEDGWRLSEAKWDEVPE